MPTWGDELPPVTKSRLAAIGRTEPEERDLANQKEDVQSLLVDFHKDDLDSHGLCRKLKFGTRFMIREAQLSLIESLSLIEEGLNKIGELRKACREAQEETPQEATEERSGNHQPTITLGRWIAWHGTLSVDANMAERLAESLLRAERMYGDEFAAAIRQVTLLIDPGK